MKAALAAILLGASLIGCQHAIAQAVQIYATFPATNGWPAIVIVGAEQLANNVCDVQVDRDPEFSGPFTGASYGCYPQDQLVVASFNADINPGAFFRSLNTPCGQDAFGPQWPMPMPADWIEPKPILTQQLSSFRTTWRGIRMRIGPEIMPTCTNGVRRFIAVPVTP